MSKLQFNIFRKPFKIINQSRLHFLTQSQSFAKMKFTMKSIRWNDGQFKILIESQFDSCRLLKSIIKDFHLINLNLVHSLHLLQWLKGRQSTQLWIFLIEESLSKKYKYIWYDTNYSNETNNSGYFKEFCWSFAHACGFDTFYQDFELKLSVIYTRKTRYMFFGRLHGSKFSCLIFPNQKNGSKFQTFNLFANSEAFHQDHKWHQV